MRFLFPIIFLFTISITPGYGQKEEKDSIVLTSPLPLEKGSLLKVKDATEEEGEIFFDVIIDSLGVPMKVITVRSSVTPEVLALYKEGVYKLRFENKFGKELRMPFKVTIIIK